MPVSAASSVNQGESGEGAIRHPAATRSGRAAQARVHAGMATSISGSLAESGRQLGDVRMVGLHPPGRRQRLAGFLEPLLTAQSLTEAERSGDRLGL